MMPQSRKIPGGPLKSRFIQGLEGHWFDPLGKKVRDPQVLRDLEYHSRFWKRQPGLTGKTVIQLRQAMLESMKRAVSHGQMALLVGSKLTEQAKAELSARRILAKENGYEIGKFRHFKRSGTAVAPIKKSE